jgi:threonine/homoserine/homoserine lactone efflux protein
MTLTTWLTFLAICGLGAMSPGPSVAVILKITVNNGRAHGLMASWFHAAGIGLWAMATVSGLAVVVARSETLFHLITWFGAAYLAWLGFKAIRAGKEGPLDVERAGKVPLWQAGREGAVISLLNPKIAIFFLALFSQFIVVEATFSDHVIMVLTPTLVDGLWYSLVSVVLSQGPILAALQKRNQIVNRVTGTVLIMLALRVVIR